MTSSETPTAPGPMPARSVLRILSVVLAVAAALWLLFELRGILLAIVLSIFFAYLIAPLLELRGLRSLPRWSAIAIVYVFVFGVGGGALYLLVPRIGNQVNELGGHAPALFTALQDRVHGLSERYDQYQVPPAVRAAVDSAAGRALETVAQGANRVLGAIFGVVTLLPWLFLIPVLAFFLLNDAAGFRETALRLLPAGRTRWRGAELVDEVNRTLAFYVRVQLVACLIIGVECFLGYAVLRVPYALILGVLACLLEFIPMVGPITAGAAAVLLARTHSASLAMATLAFVILVRAVHNYAVYPRLIARGTKLHPLAIILSILCGAELGGIAGLFLAIPLTAVISVAYRYAMLQLGSEGLVQSIMHVEEPPDVVPISLAVPAALDGGMTMPALPSATALHGISMVVIDNEEDARGMLVEVLQRAGAQVWDASSVPEALELVARIRPDMLLSDIGMPNEDGFDLIRQLRARDVAHGGGTPAAALTAYITDEDRERTLKAGFQAHLDKPVDIAALVSTILRLTGKSRPAAT